MRKLVQWILLFLLWLVLTFNLALPNLIVGAAASLLTVLIFGRYFVSDVKKIFQPRRYLWFFVYSFIFLWACIKANVDVAYRVLHPKMPIRPGIVKFKTVLKSEMARTMLANSITMTPGTITVDIIGDYFYIHWIYVRTQNPEEAGQEIAGSFEKYIQRIFE
jgi:multicomponent Na+:H+ antiporter subunit E